MAQFTDQLAGAAHSNNVQQSRAQQTAGARETSAPQGVAQNGQRLPSLPQGPPLPPSLFRPPGSRAGSSVSRTSSVIQLENEMKEIKMIVKTQAAAIDTLVQGRRDQEFYTVLPPGQTPNTDDGDKRTGMLSVNKDNTVIDGITSMVPSLPPVLTSAMTSTSKATAATTVTSMPATSAPTVSSIPAITAAAPSPNVVAPLLNSAISALNAPNTTFQPVVTQMTVPKFTGKQSLAKYLTQFENFARLCHWPEAEWGRQLIAALDGKALGILTVETLSPNPSYEEVAAKMKANFGPEVASTVYMHDLSTMERGETESLKRLCLRVKEKAVKAFPELDGTLRSRYSVPHFINALTNEQQKAAIWAARVTSLEEALAVAMACENGARVSSSNREQTRRRLRKIEEDSEMSSSEEDDEGKPAVVRTIHALAQSMNQQFKEINSKLQNKTQSAAIGTATSSSTGQSIHQSKSNGQGRNKRCPSCKEHGHVLSKCPKPRHNRCFICEQPGHRAKDCSQRCASNQGLAEGRGAEGQAPELALQ
jgi:hypothetical protein